MSEETNLVTPAFDDSISEDYTPPVVEEKKGRGRPKKIEVVEDDKAVTKKVKAKTRRKLSKEEEADAHSKSVIGLENLLIIGTNVAAKFTEAPELAFDQVDAHAMSEALVNCLEAWFPNSHGMILSPKLSTTVSLGVTTGMIVMKKKAQRAEKVKALENKDEKSQGA